MIVDFAALPRLDGACRIGIVMPAKNEADVVEHALAAFAAQRDTSGTALDPRSYEILVFCNDCDDGTAAVARRFARRRPDLAVHVVEAAFAAESAHVGTARRAALDLAASRFTSAERTSGTIASVDADTIVDPTWVASMLAEIAHADAVAGHVLVAGDERDRMLAPLRLLYDRECEYRRMLGVVEARYDPLPYDVGPRHDSFVGASFAVTVAAYAASGGLPPLPRLEDLAFAQALQRIDARIRHSYAVRAHTSARQTSRVAGGFGSFVAELATKSGPRSTFAVRAARAAVESARARGLLRSAWFGRPDADADAIDAAAELVGFDRRALGVAAARAATFGAFWLDIEPRTRQSAYPDEPVEAAIAALRQTLAESNAPLPTRARTASGAG